MPRQAVVYTVVVASAVDTDEERQAVLEAIHAWNTGHSAATGVVLLPMPWESDRVILRDADILIGTFWTRLGTASVEIDAFRKAGKRVLLYFSDGPAIPSKANREQYDDLENYRLRCEREHLAEGYGSVGELRAKLPQHLATVVRELHAPPPEPAAGRAGPAKVVVELRPADPPRAEPSPAPPVSAPQRPDIAPRPEPARPSPIASRAADPAGVQEAATVVREGGWSGVSIGDDFYAWEGPLTDLPEDDPVEMSRDLDPRLRTALSEAGALPSWQTKSDLLTWRDEQRVFITDRRTYKRAVVNGKDVLFVRSAP
jgi:hypothetical protein